MKNPLLRMPLKVPLIIDLALVGIATLGFLKFYSSNNWESFAGDKGQYYFQKGETHKLFTRRVYSKAKLEGKESEAYYEYGLFSGRGYTDKEPLDRVVDEISLYDFRGRETFHWTKGEEIDNTRLDKANENFARNRRDFLPETQRYGIN